MSNIGNLVTQQLGMSSVLAVRNLIHDRVRLIVTLVGVVFAVVLVNVEVGLFLGFTSATSSLIDRSGADLWVMAKGTRNVDQAAPISERKLYEALAIPGVQRAARLNVEFAYFKRPDGGTESVLVVGFDPDSGLGGPWNVVAGDVRNLRYPNTIAIDEFYRQKLGITHIGQLVEISGRQARVVAFTRGIWSFTQSPYVFASTRTSIEYSRIRDDQTKYILVSVATGTNESAARAALAQGLPDTQVLTAEEFSRLTQRYWMFTTGAGLALLVAALMGFAVGAVVISQTLYATTVDHLAEFGTLRAIGASARYLYAVIIRQAILVAVIGFSFGLMLTLLVERSLQDSGPAILLPQWIEFGMLGLTIAMCVGAALISIRKVTRLDPSMVFK